MPRLTRLRFVNIGHPNARMDDLTLHLCDEENHPVDSTLWLRNAGGKSSLLSLFFSLINPNRYQFLGAKVATGERTLDDYVLSEDHSVVVAEWQLDTAPNDEPVWYLTGGFYEWRHENIERLFFAARVRQPDLTFESLPLKDKNGRRLTIHGFKQDWQNLGKRYPQAEAQETDSQQEWRRVLEQARIDPELFSYQIRMNSQEGGADELFRFRDTDHFVDFFLNMAMPADRSNQISSNLEKFRGRLRERQEQLLPGLELIERLKPKVQLMIEVASRRLEHIKQTGELQRNLKQLLAIVEQHLLVVSRRTEQVAELRRAAMTASQNARREVELQQTRMLSLQRRRLELRSNRFADEQQNLEKQLRAAEHDHLIWQAAIPLAEIERYEEKIRELQNLLQIQNAQLAPEWNEIHKAARAYSAALLARANENRQLSRLRTETAKTHQAIAKQARQDEKDTRANAVRAEARAEQTGRQIELAKVSRAKLEKSKTLEFKERLQPAGARWQQKLNELKFEADNLVKELETAEKQLNSFETELSNAKDYHIKASHELQIARQILEDAQIKRDALLDDAVLIKLLEEVNVAALNSISLSRIKEARAEAETLLRNLKAEIAGNEYVFEYLRSRLLLPPMRDILTILQILAGEGITAWAGWEHVSEYHSKREDARAFIGEHPEIVQGVLVKDDHFPKAQAALAQSNIYLNSAVLVGTKSLTLDSGSNGSGSPTDAQKRFVVGPTSDAHFDKNTAKSEEHALELRLRQERVDCEETERWSLDLRDAAERLEQFISLHPHEWFVQRKAELSEAEIYNDECEKRLTSLERERGEKREQIESFKRKRERLLDEKHLVEEHARKLNAHCEHHGTDEKMLELEKQKIADETKAVSLLNEAAEKEKIVAAEESAARQLADEARKSESSAERDERESGRVKYLEEERLSPEVGDVDGLRDNHQRLCDLIEKKTDGNNIQAELERARHALSQLQERFSGEFDERVDEAEVRRQLLEIADKSVLRMKADDSLNRVSRLNQSVGMAKSETHIARKELEQHLNQHAQLKLTLTTEEQDLSEEELEQKSSSAKNAMDAAAAHAAQQEQEIVRLKDEDSQLQLQKRNFEEWKTRTANSLADEKLFRDAVEPEPTSETALPETRIGAYLKEQEKQMHAARQQQDELYTERQRIYKSFSNSLGNVDFAFTKALKEWDEEILEQDAPALLRELETREKNMRDELEESEKHRSLLVTELLAVGDRGVKMLSGLATNSKLPASVGTLAKQPFLKINLKKMEPPEQRQRIESLLDDVIREGQTPKGIELMQRAVRKLSQPMTVQVLFPDIDAPPRYIQITAMSKESGGERLTSAVLLYCALAQQRARERGLNFNVSGTLLLDNPVGAASRTKFLELQRETARAMNIQLVYATGVNDFEAIRTMPNIVKLRNERSNHKNQRLLEAVRVVRPEDNL